MLAAGHACVALLSMLRALPPEIAARCLRPALLLYPRFRPRHVSRLRACFAASPFADRLDVPGYYAARLRLLLEGLRAHGRDAAPGTKVEGMEHYLEALAEGRPVALVGLHAGPLEELHRIPPAPEGRPFRILTVPAFSPPLTAFMARGRRSAGKEILWIGSRGPQRSKAGQRPEAERRLEAGLRRIIAGNGVLALMADQHPGQPEACEYLALWDRVRVPYPGRLLRFLTKAGFLFVPVSVRRGTDGSSAFRFHPATREASPASIRAFLEEAISRAPEQWNWSYPKIGVHG